MSWKDALNKVSVVASSNRSVPVAASVTAPATTSVTAPDVEPCNDITGKRCAALVAVLGLSKAKQLLQNESTASYGNDRRAQAMEGAINAAMRQMTTGKSREIDAQHGADLNWRFRRAQDQSDAMYAALEALTSGSYQAWENMRANAAQAPKWPAPPATEVLTSYSTDFEREHAIREYMARYVTWYEERTGLEVEQLEALHPAEFERVMREEVHAVLLERATNTWRAIIADRMASYEAGEIDDAALMVGKDTLGFSEARNALGYGDLWFGHLAEHTRRAWSEGATVKGEDPPQGWDALSEGALVLFGTSYATHDIPNKATRELFRRSPEPRAILGFDGVLRVFTGARVIKINTFRSHEIVAGPVQMRPHPQGWVVEKENGAQPRGFEALWASPAHYQAYTRLMNLPKGMCNVRRIFTKYGTHETKNFGRFVVGGLSDGLIIGVASPIESAMNDIALLHAVHPVLVPEHAWWLNGHLRKTTGGGLYLQDGNRTVQALVAYTGALVSMGPRRGMHGHIPGVHSNNRALAVEYVGGRGANITGGFVAAVERGTPLLLADGSGRILGANDDVYVVPGLAEGRPGNPVLE